MSQKLTVNGKDLTNYLEYASLAVKLNTCDFALIDVPAVDVPALGHAVILKDPHWEGTVVTAGGEDIVDRSTGHIRWTFAATNPATIGTTVAPFGLSSSPSAAADSLFLLENGTDTYGLEDDSAWAPADYAMENTADTYGYRGYKFQSQLNSDSSSTDVFTLTCTQPGLWPGMTLLITSANFNITGAASAIAQVSVSWQGANEPQPIFEIQFGNTAATAVPFTLNDWKAGP